MYRGYIKIWRKVRDSFIWEDEKALKLWTHLLMDANYEDKETIFNNEKLIIKRGQLITGRQSLERQLGINESKIYRLLDLFEKEQLIEQRKTNLFTIISIVCYEQYQSNEQLNEQPVNNQRTTSEQPVNTPKYIKNTLRSIKKNVYAHPTIEEIAVYCKERNNHVNPQKFIDFYTAKGWMIGKNKMKDWQAAVRTWERKEDKPRLMETIKREAENDKARAGSSHGENGGKF